ncbi:MAG: putative quinol monooxygenase [Hyphomicrobiaceae bacterium]
MAVGIIRSVRVKRGKVLQFESLMRDYGNAIAASEPGCRMRALMRSPTDRLRYTVHEEYWSEEAWQVHNLTDHRAKYCPAILSLVVSCDLSRFDIEPEDAHG